MSLFRAERTEAQAAKQQRILEGDHFLRPAEDYTPTPTNRELFERIDSLQKAVIQLQQIVFDLMRKPK